MHAACNVLGAGAGASRRCGKPVDPAGGVSCGGRVGILRSLQRTVNWCHTGPLICGDCCCEIEAILRCGFNSTTTTSLCGMTSGCESRYELAQTHDVRMYEQRP